jgi:hypothetical protein
MEQSLEESDIRLVDEQIRARSSLRCPQVSAASPRSETAHLNTISSSFFPDFIFLSISSKSSLSISVSRLKLYKGWSL